MSLSQRLAELVSACFTGLWVQSFERQDALEESLRLPPGELALAVWDIEKGLRVPGQGSGQAIDAGGNDPLAAIRSINALASADSSAILVLVNFHRFLQSAEIVQALEQQITTGKTNRTFIIVLSPLVAIPCELERAFCVVEHELPDQPHQSWLSDGRHRRHQYGGRGQEGWIVVIDTQSGTVTPLVRHNSHYTSDQSTHPHVIGSPDATKAVFNSTNEGKQEPQAYVVQVRRPSTVVNARASRTGSATVLNWELPPMRAEIASVVIQRVTKQGTAEVASVSPAEVSWTDPNPDNVIAYEICTKEYSGLRSEAIRCPHQ